MHEQSAGHRMCTGQQIKLHNVYLNYILFSAIVIHIYDLVKSQVHPQHIVYTDRTFTVTYTIMF